MTARLTIISSHRPATLSKTVLLGADGSLVHEAGGLLVDGHAEIATVASFGDLADLLQNLGPAQALTFGIPKTGSGRILSRAALDRCGSSDGITTRTRDQFVWPAGAGVLMIDHDPGEVPLSRDDLVGIIRGAASGLADASMLWWPSASSHICNEATGEDLTGLRGQRLYLMVSDASDIPRAGSALVDRLWAAGHGRIAVSSAGTALERCPVDASVWQPERLDFAAGAICHDGLAQRRGSPWPIPGCIDMVDTRSALPDDPEITTAATAARLRARKGAAAELEAAREAFLDRRASSMLPPEEDDGEKRGAVRAVVRRAVEQSVLTEEFPVEVELAPGRFGTVTVGQILDDRHGFHGRLTRDPLEPDYDGGRAVGKLFLLDPRPTLFSFARGGRSFRLIRSPERIEVPKGRLAAATETTLGVLRNDPAVFDFGGQVALVENGTISTLDEHSLGYHLAGGIQFWQQQKVGGEVIEVDVDPPTKLVRQILSLGHRRQLKPLVAIVTAPTLRPDGSVLSRPGYDPGTSLLICLEEPVEIPASPSREEVREALDALLHPFGSFPLVDRFASGALLAALLTAVVRSALVTAPAFAMDAPVQGSGKTLLASCVAALSTGRVPEVWPHTAGRDDEEVRKRLFAALRDGSTALVWDNITGVFDSAALASAITAPVIRDRVLGRSESLSIPNRALLLLTGNNLCPAGDLPRRIIPIRIDPGTDMPFARQFDLDPLAYVLAHRGALARAALVLIRGWLTSGAPRAGGRTASFEAWDDLVRQTVCWIGTVVAPGKFGDVLELIRRAQGSDPEQESLFALLEALDAVFTTGWFTARDVSRRALQGRSDALAGADATALADALSEIGAERSLASTKSVGRILKFREGRIAMGLRLRSRSSRTSLEYHVEAVDDTYPRGFGGFGGFDSGDSDSVVDTTTESDRRDSNPPNPPNPHWTSSDAGEDW